MDYNSFLTRDYKSMTAPASTAPKRWTRVHTVVVLASLIALATLLSLASQNANANKPDQLVIPEKNKKTTVVSKQADTKQQITIPLSIPEDTAQPEQISQVEEPDQWINFKVKSGDSLAYLFQKNQLHATELHQIMKLGGETRSLRKIKPGQHFRVRANEQQQIHELFYDVDKLESLHVKRTENGFRAERVTRPVDVRTSFSSAVINSSLFEAGKNAGMKDALIMQLVGIFGLSLIHI